MLGVHSEVDLISFVCIVFRVTGVLKNTHVGKGHLKKGDTGFIQSPFNRVVSSSAA